MKVLVIEDSARLRRAIAQGLSRSGFVVDVASDGEEGLGYIRSAHYDVVVLDLMMPRLDGLSLLKIIRGQGNDTHVLVLSARDEVQDRILGLQSGADDYLIKPFVFDELVARLMALARRHHDSKSPTLDVGALRLETTRRHVSANGQDLNLTPAEYNLLEYLVMRKGRVVSKDLLHDVVTCTDSETSSNVVEVLVSNLRKKIMSTGADRTIQTKRGFGYLIDL